MIRVCLVGNGRWGEVVAANLRSLGADVRVYDANPKRSALLSIESAAEGCSHAVIATPPTEDRARIVQIVADAGVQYVRLEKPVADTLAGITSVVDACEEHGITATAGHTTLSARAIPDLQKTLGRLVGRIRVVGHRLSGDAGSAPSPMVDLAPHCLGILWSTLGKPRDPIGDESWLTVTSDRYDAILNYSWTHHEKVREYTFEDESGEAVVYDELNGRIIDVYGEREYVTGNEVQRELATWLQGGGVPLAFGAHVSQLVAAAAGTCSTPIASRVS